MNLPYKAAIVAGALTMGVSSSSVAGSGQESDPIMRAALGLSAIQTSGRTIDCTRYERISDLAAACNAFNSSGSKIEYNLLTNTRGGDFHSLRITAANGEVYSLIDSPEKDVGRFPYSVDGTIDALVTKKGDSLSETKRKENQDLCTEFVDYARSSLVDGILGDVRKVIEQEKGGAIEMRAYNVDVISGGFVSYYPPMAFGVATVKLESGKTIVAVHSPHRMIDGFYVFNHAVNADALDEISADVRNYIRPETFPTIRSKITPEIGINGTTPYSRFLRDKIPSLVNDVSQRLAGKDLDTLLRGIRGRLILKSDGQKSNPNTN